MNNKDQRLLEDAIDWHFSCVQKSDSAMDVICALLGSGFFAKQLPPPFVSISYGNAFKSSAKKMIEAAKESLKENKTAEMLKFNHARPDRLRRVLGVPNPLFYLLLSNVLSLTYLEELQRNQSDGKITAKSSSYPVFKKKDENVKSLQFAETWQKWPEIRLQTRALNKYCVQTDISRFFQSIYTHAIHWAIAGKQKAKEERGKKHLKDKGNFVDLISRNMQSGQTLGIPVGPDTSFIISEIILSRVDEELEKFFKEDNIDHHHYVDDYEFASGSIEGCHKALAIFQQALAEYELEINTQKTRILSLPQSLQDREIQALREYSFNEGQIEQKHLNEYFDIAFNCFHKHPKGALKYAIKKLPEDLDVSDSLLNFFIHCMILEPGVIEAVLYWLSKNNKLDFLDTNSRKRLAGSFAQIIKDHAHLNHASEVAWSIWGFLLLDMDLPKSLDSEISCMDDSVVMLLAIDAINKSLTTWKSEIITKATDLINDSGLYGKHWMLVYQAQKSRMLDIYGNEDNLDIHKDPFFRFLAENDVNFYVEGDLKSYIELMQKNHSDGYEQLSESEIRNLISDLLRNRAIDKDKS